MRMPKQVGDQNSIVCCDMQLSHHWSNLSYSLFVFVSRKMFLARLFCAPSPPAPRGNFPLCPRYLRHWLGYTVGYTSVWEKERILGPYRTKVNHFVLILASITTHQVEASNLRSRGRGFGVQLQTLGKLFTSMCFCRVGFDCTNIS